eukprot:CCRYP_006928-RA/>CCRYP_006928-RA protein AED:0.55 eAED:0.46 QI:0/0/0/0.5/0/0/2/0/70
MGRLLQLAASPVKKQGSDLPSNKNIADYLESRDPKVLFPNSFIFAQGEALYRVVEAGWKRFFNLSLILCG